MEQKHAVVLLSGGLDSTTALATAIDDGYTIHALTFNYGQRHQRELEAAKNLTEFYIIPDHVILDLDLKQIGRSALLENTSKLPENREMSQIGTGIPPTYVPARNLVMLSLGMAWAESIGAEAVYIGVNSIDYSGYPDCRPEFIQAFENAAKLGTKTGVEGKPIAIRCPLVNMTKAEIIKHGSKLGVPYKLTWSCYQGGILPCGVCDSCKLRLKGFQEAGINDPLDYEK